MTVSAGCTWTRTIALAAILPCALLTASAPASPALAREVSSVRSGEYVEIRASARLSADRATAWRVLTDYARYPEFIPGLEASRVIARSGGTVTVEQQGSMVLGPLHLPLQITFQIEERPPGGVESRAVAGSLRSLESRYQLIDEAGGVRFVYVGRVRPGFPLFGRFGQAAVEANVSRQFHALVDEIERQRRTQPP